MRSMSPAMLAALTSTQLNPAIFVQLQFVSGIVYVWSGYGSITWNGQTWIGVGSFGGIQEHIEEGTSVEARGMTLMLSGIDQSMLADALQEIQLGMPVTVYLALFTNASPITIISDPLVTWQGRIDQPTINVSGQAATIALACESRLIDGNVAVDRRYTQDDQQIDYPGDLGFQFINGLQNQTIYWGQTPLSTNNI